MMRILQFMHTATALLLLLLVFATAKARAEEHSVQPKLIDGFPNSNTEYSGFSTTGRITDINRRVAKITIHSDTPFYAPWAPSVAVCALWPNSAPLILHVSNGVTITLNGKKAGIDQLAVGQIVKIQYSIYVFWHGGDEVFCGARRIEANTSLTKSR